MSRNQYYKINELEMEHQRFPEDDNEEQQDQQEDAAYNDVLGSLKVTREKLRLISSVSSIMAGFSVVGLVELQVGNNIQEGVLIAYSITLCLVITLHIFAVLISVCVLPSLEYIIHLHTSRPKFTTGLLSQRYSVDPPPSSSNTAINSSSEDFGGVQDVIMGQKRLYTKLSEVAWVCSMGLGIIGFTAEVILIVWIKLSEFSRVAALCGALLSAPLGILFFFFAYFMRANEGVVVKNALSRKHHVLQSKLGALSSLVSPKSVQKEY